MIRPSSVCRELNDTRVTSSMSIFAPLRSHVPISNHSSITIIVWWQRRWRRQRIRGCCTHRGDRSARRLIAWMAIEKWITPCTTCADSPWWSRQVKLTLYRDKGNGPLETLPLTDYLVFFFTRSLSFCLPFVSINYNAHSWFFYACKVCVVHSMASIVGDKATRQIEKIETVLDSFFVVRKIEILVAGKWNIILSTFSKNSRISERTIPTNVSIIT